MFNRKLAKFLRNQKGLTQTQLAELCDVHPVTISNWERGEKQPDANNIQALAQALGTTTDDLMTSDEYNAARAKQMTTENKNAPAETKPGEGAKTRRIISMEDWIKVPIVSRECTACCGSGITAADITNWDEGFILFPRTELRALDDLRRPYAVHCDGDCMESAGILDGDLAVINPAEEPLQGTVVLVSIGGSLSLKRYYAMPNGDVILKSDHEPIRLTPEEQERDEFTICGVLAGTHRGRPKAWPL